MYFIESKKTIDFIRDAQSGWNRCTFIVVFLRFFGVLNLKISKFINGNEVLKG